MSSNSLFGVTFCYVATLACLRGGMDAETLPTSFEAVQMGKLYQLPRGWWYVHCRWCEKEASFQVRNLEEAYGMLEKWRLDSDERQAHWSCPACCEYWDGRERATTDTAGTAATNTTTTSFDARELEVVALKAEVGELKAATHRSPWTSWE